jgi:hypothetical protein
MVKNRYTVLYLCWGWFIVGCPSQVMVTEVTGDDRLLLADVVPTGSVHPSSTTPKGSTQDAKKHGRHERDLPGGLPW